MAFGAGNNVIWISISAKLLNWQHMLPDRQRRMGGRLRSGGHTGVEQEGRFLNMEQGNFSLLVMTFVLSVILC